MVFRRLAPKIAIIGSVGMAFGMLAGLAACRGGGNLNDFLGGGFLGQFVGSGGTNGGGGGGGADNANDNTDTDTGSGNRSDADPCSLPQPQKFIRISMRNQAPDFIHYFLALIAFVRSDTHPDGVVCEDDIGLYTAFGYQQVVDGQSQAFGNECIVGPALIYFHRSGQFRSAGATINLASGIGPAQGSTPTFDTFFTSAGAQVPVPNQILFHNPGTGEGAGLKVSRGSPDPCANVIGLLDPACQQDAFYYVDEGDLLAGSRGLGQNSGRRIPAEIQGTACQCLGAGIPFQVVAPSNTAATATLCDEFVRGARIEYVFFREDRTPPFPQLVWRVTDSGGQVVHDFDSRAPVR
ncbi:hypothetical protein RAS1_38900 [Phycisphaerae bacterium RAS1]|nr:hypothetical protein RAS1_38900 [Phycisphaerae bacterium RAS1]